MIIDRLKKISPSWLLPAGPGSAHKGDGRVGSAFIPFDLHSSVGGPATFLKNLRGYLDKVAFPYARDLGRANVILFPISYDLQALKKFKKRGGRICQRLDGVYYPGKHGADYTRRNEKMREIYLYLADHVIFQSEYSRIQCFDMFGEKSRDAYSIIVNGVNTDIFSPDRDRVFDRRQVHFCTTGSIRNADMLVPVIKALDLLVGQVDFRFHVVGPVKNEQCAQFMDRGYLVHHDKCDLHRVAEILRASDIFIYSHLNPPCPNSVLEAVASGLPVVGYDSGAMAELLPFSTGLLADAGEKIYHDIGDFHPERLADRLMAAVDDYSAWREASLRHCADYAMDVCGGRYVDVLGRLMTQK